MMDTHRLANYFQQNEWEVVRCFEEADQIVLTTCAYSKEKGDESLEAVRRLSKQKAGLIITGCLPAIEPTRLGRISSHPEVHPSDLAAIDKLFPFHRIRFSDIPESNYLWEETTCSETLKQPRFFVSIGKGCLGRCAFCAIPHAVGSFRSKPLEECLAEVRRGLDSGYRRFHLVSEDVGAYGLDLGLSFPRLLQEIVALDRSLQVKFDDFRPRWAVKYLDELLPLVKESRVYSILSPIQSGNSQVLRAMKRYGDTQRIKRALRLLQRANLEFTLVTNCIVGFPTESESAFNETLKMIRFVNFDAGRIFPYSPRENTPGERMEGKVPEEEIQKRLGYATMELESQGYEVTLEAGTLHFVRHTISG